MNRRLRLLVSLACLVLPRPALSAAAWTGAGDGWSWSDASNWEDGLLPSGGETVWIRPVAGNGWVEIGGAVGGGAITLAIESPIALNLMLNPEARLAGVTTLDGWAHRVSGAPEATSTWQVATGGSVTLESLFAGSTVVKDGPGALTLGAGATGSGGLRVSGLGGTLVLEVADPLALSGARLEATGASFSFQGEVARAGTLLIGEGSFSPMSGGRLVADEVIVHRSGTLDLAYLPGITAGELRITGGGVRLASSLAAERIVVRGSTLEMGSETVSAPVDLSGGWLDGGVVVGELRVDVGDGMTGWSGAGRMEAGSRLVWKPVASEAAALFVFGALDFAEGSLVAIGEGDWASPYWDEARMFAFVDTWSGGVVRGMPGLEGAVIEGRGRWAVAGDAQGGLALSWSPEAAPVPEASALGWVGAASMAAALARVRRRERRPA